MGLRCSGFSIDGFGFSCFLYMSFWGLRACKLRPFYYNKYYKKTFNVKHYGAPGSGACGAFHGETPITPVELSFWVGLLVHILHPFARVDLAKITGANLVANLDV